MNADGLFLGKDEATISDLSRDGFAAVLASMVRPLTKRLFVGTIISQIR
jgi:hypothetical protein